MRACVLSSLTTSQFAKVMAGDVLLRFLLYFVCVHFLRRAIVRLVISNLDFRLFFVLLTYRYLAL